MQAIDKVSPGIVDWKRANKVRPVSALQQLRKLSSDPPISPFQPDEEESLALLNRKQDQGLSRFKMVENNNLALDLAKRLGFSLVGVQGADITDGNVVLVLGMFSQFV